MIRYKANPKKKDLLKDNLTVYLDYNREQRIYELLDARDECLDEIEILMNQISKKLKKRDLKLGFKRGKRVNDLIHK